MNTIPFLEYLHEHSTSRALAENLGGVLVLRRRPDLLPATMWVPQPRLIAS